MKPSFIFSLLILSVFLNEAQGIRLEKWSKYSNHHKLITKSLSSNGEDGSAMATEVSSGINRKLMTKITLSRSTTSNDKNYKNDPTRDLKISHKLVNKEETFPTTFVSSTTHEKQTEVVSERYADVIDITGMDYSPAKRKPPIHN